MIVRKNANVTQKIAHAPKYGYQVNIIECTVGSLI